VGPIIEPRGSWDPSGRRGAWDLSSGRRGSWDPSGRRGAWDLSSGRRGAYAAALTKRCRTLRHGRYAECCGCSDRKNFFATHRTLHLPQGATCEPNGADRGVLNGPIATPKRSRRHSTRVLRLLCGGSVRFGWGFGYMGLFDVLSVRRSPAGFAPVIVIGQGLVCYGRGHSMITAPVVEELAGRGPRAWRGATARSPGTPSQCRSS
jgi:hypothetical protein